MTGLIVKTTAAALVVVALALFVTTDLARRLAAPQAPVETQAAAPAVDAPRPSRASGGSERLRRTSNGHFVAEVRVNGVPMRMMVDTGASLVVLNEDDAARAGIRPFPSDYKLRLGTANGTTLGARTILREVQLGSIVVRDVQAVILKREALATGGLLGMSFLSRLGGFETTADTMVLKP
ncbi:MAG: TIGR02281 family clan AA aspartic protease [Pseudomonadota bacterium]|jgi:aspartyl protease family protein|nr:MAG: TIGR02281 family clan AA aspartic protease [Pseudomonadota bacterium]